MRLGWDQLSEADELVLKDYAKNAALIFEIGTFLGGTAEAMFEACPEARIVCVDTFQAMPQVGARRFSRGEAILILMERMAQFGDRFTIIIGESTSVAATITPGIADLVFIDGAHDYPSVLADLRAWLPIIKPTGWMAGHDFELETRGYPQEFRDEMSLLQHDRKSGLHFGVSRALEETFETLERDGSNRSSVWRAKPDWVRT